MCARSEIDCSCVQAWNTGKQCFEAGTLRDQQFQKIDKRGMMIIQARTGEVSTLASSTSGQPIGCSFAQQKTGNHELAMCTQPSSGRQQRPGKVFSSNDAQFGRVEMTWKE